MRRGVERVEVGGVWELDVGVVQGAVSDMVVLVMLSE